jgi:hypothetical protein
VHVALGLSGLDGRKDFQVDVVEEIGPAPEERDLGRCLDVPHLLHHGRAVDHLESGEAALDLLPVRDRHRVPLESHPRAVQR